MNLNKYKVKNRQGDIEPHEVFLDKLAKAKEEEWGITVKKLEVPLQEKLAYFIFGIFSILVIVLFSKTFYWQVIQGQSLALLSENNRLRIQLVRPERGVIYDKNLKQMVFNLPAFDLVCDKRDVGFSPFEKIEAIDEIADITGQAPETLKKTIKESSRPRVLISENLPHQTLVSLEAKINNFPGFEIEKNTVRDYIDGSYLAHLIGFVSKINKEELLAYQDYSVSDYIGKTGVEKSYEEILRGKPGKIQIEKDAFGKIKKEKVLSLPEAGKSLVLYLDSDLQKKLTEELQKKLDTLGLKKATAVAIDPRNGGVLALVSIPSFDNNILSKGISVEDLKKLQDNPYNPFFNRAISGQYPTGSTIKPLMACAALEEKIISAQKQIYDPGFIEVKNKYDPSIVYRYHDLKSHGWVDIRKAISESCNVYFYTVGGGYQDQKGLGPTLIKKYLELFGWGNKTQIDLPGEATGFIPWPEWKKEVRGENWFDGDTYHLAIGQGDISITPLQVALAFAAIANAGKLYQPQVVKEIVDTSAGSGQDTSTGSVRVLQKIEPKILRQDFISPENLKIVQEGMRQAVVEGTGRVFSTLPVKAASKSGTAQFSRENYYHVWANVYAPYEDPQIVLTVVMEEVEGLAAPSLTVARDVLDWYFARQ